MRPQDSLEDLEGTVVSVGTTPVSSLPLSAKSGQSVFAFNRLALAITGGAIGSIAVIGVIALLVAGSGKDSQSKGTTPDSFSNSSLELSDIDPKDKLNLAQADQLAINGELKVNQGLILAPSNAPLTPTAGQIYYDQTSNAPFFYNGTQFVSLAPTVVPQSVSSIGGVSGAISIGNGLQLTNGQLSAITAAGRTGVQNIVSGSSSIAVSQDGNGNFTLSNNAVVGTGTTGQIALFTGGSTVGGSILSQSSGNINVGGGLVVTGAISAQSGVLSNSLAQTAAGQNVTVSAGNDAITFTAGGRNFSFPTSGPASQTICTTGISCAAGGGEAIVLQPGTAQLDTGSGSSIYVNNRGGGNILELQGNGSTRFVVTNSGNTTVGGSLTVSTLAAGIVQSSAGGVLTSSTLDRNSATLLTGTLSVANGGTGTTSLAPNGILYGNGTGAVQATAIATNSILATNGSNVPGLTQTLPTVVQGNITTTGILGSGSIATGFGSISTTNAITTTAALQGGSLSVAGGNFTVNASGNITTTGVASIQGAGGLSLGVTGSVNGSLVFRNSTNSNLTTLQGLAPAGQSQTITIPASTAATDTVCLLSLANCVGTGGGVTASGATANYIPKFTGGTQLGNSLIYDSGTRIGIGTITPGAFLLDVNGAANIAGALSVSGAITASTSLSVTNGLTSGGTTRLSSLTAGVVKANASGVLSTGTVALGVETTGNYVANLGTLTGLTTSGNTGAGSTPTLSVTYGSSSTSAVRGDTALTCAAGTGNLSGGGNALVLGSGGSCNNLTISNSPTFSGSLSVQGAGGVSLGVAGTTSGALTFANSANTNTGTVQLATLSQNTTFILPNVAAASVEFCVTSGNCADNGTSGNYIRNGTTQQTSANFNIAGNGTIGGLVTATNGYYGNVANTGIPSTYGSAPLVVNNNFGVLNDGFASFRNGVSTTVEASAGATLGVLKGNQTQAKATGTNFYLVSGVVGNAQTDTTGTTNRLNGVVGLADNVSTGTVVSASALIGEVDNVTTGVIQNAYGLQTGIYNDSTGSITNAYGAQFKSPGVSAGSIGTAYGLDIQAQKVSGVGVGYGIYQQGANDLNVLNGALALNNTLTVTSVAAVSATFSGRVIGANAVNNNEFTTLSQVSGAVSGAAGSYIANGTTQQAGANFNIAGNGTIGGNLDVQQTAFFGNDVNSTNPLGVINIDARQTIADASAVTFGIGLLNVLTVNSSTNTSAGITGTANEVYLQGNNNYLSDATATYNTIYKSGSGSAAGLTGLESNVSNSGSGTVNSAVASSSTAETSDGLINTAVGLQGGVDATSIGSIGTARASSLIVRNLGTGTVTNGYSQLIQSAVNSGGGSFLNNYGLYIQDQSGVGSVNSYNLYSAGANAKNFVEGKLQVGSTSTLARVNIGTNTDTTAAGGINFGGDTSLYRVGTQNGFSTLKTDGSLQAGGQLIASRDDPTGQISLTTQAGMPVIYFGNDNTVQLIRSAANTLKTVNNLEVGTGTGIVGNFSGRVVGGNAVANNEFATFGQLTGAVSGASGNYIANSTALQMANFNIQSSAAGSVGGIIRGAASQTADLFNVITSAGINSLQVRTNLTRVNGEFEVGSVSGTSGYTTINYDDINDRGTISAYNGGYKDLALGSDGSLGGVGILVKPNRRVTIGVGSINPSAILHVFNNESATAVGQIIQGYPGQTADLLQLQNSAGTVLSKFDSDGALTLANVDGTSAKLSSIASYFTVDAGPNAIRLQGGAGANNVFIPSATAGSTVVVIRGAAGQTGDLLQLQNSGGGPLARVDAAGNLYGQGGFYNGDLAVRSGGGATQVSIGAVGPGATAGIAFGTDTNLYRSLAGRLQTSGDFFADGTLRSAGGFNSSTVSSGIGIQNTSGLYGQGYVGKYSGTEAQIAFGGDGTQGAYYGSAILSGSGAIALGGMSNQLVQTSFVSQAGTTIFAPYSGSTGLAVRGAISQTADLFQLQNSAGATLSTFDAQGRLAIGAPSVNNNSGNSKLYVTDTSAGDNTATVAVVRNVNLPANAGLTGAQGSYAGLFSTNVTTGGGTTEQGGYAGAVQNRLTVASAYNLNFFGNLDVNFSRLDVNAALSNGGGNGISVYRADVVASANITNTSGVNGFSSNLSLANGVSVNNFTGLLANSPTLGSGATLTTAYGVRISPQKATGVTTAYGIYQAGTADLNLFQGTISSPGSVTGSERFGLSSSVTSNFSLAVGNSSVSSGGDSTALGTGATASGLQTVALGTSSTATGSASTALGTYANATANGSIAIGTNAAVSSGTGNSIAIGQGATITNGSAIAIGTGATSTENNQLVIGSTNTAISNAFVGNGVTNATPTAFTLQGTGSATAGTAGAEVVLKAGAGATTTTGSSGGTLRLQGGASGGTGTNVGGAVIIEGGISSGTRFGSSVNITGGAGVGSNQDGGSVNVQGGLGTGGNNGTVNIGRDEASYGRFQIGRNILVVSAGVQFASFQTASNSGRLFLGSTGTAAGRLHVVSQSATEVSTVIQGSATQSADLLQLQNSAGALVANFSASGRLTAIGGLESSAGIITRGTNDVGTLVSIRNASDAGVFTIGADGSLTGLSGLFASTATNTNALAARASSGQTADIFQIQNSAGTVLSAFDANGNLTVGTAANPRSISSPGAGTQTERFGAGASTGASNYSLAVGSSASATATGTVAIGMNATAGGDGYNVVLGNGATANTGAQSVAIGSSAVARGDNSIALGNSASTTGTAGIALGSGATAVSGSIAIGVGTSTTAAGQLVIGNTFPGYGDISSVYIGNGVTNTAPLGFSLQGTGSSTAGTAGATVTLKAGAGATTTTGSSGGTLTLQGGASGGTGNNQGGSVNVVGGVSTGTSAGSTVNITGGAGVGTNQNGGNVNIQGGLATGGGFNGTVTIGSGAPTYARIDVGANIIINSSGSQIATFQTYSNGGRLLLSSTGTANARLQAVSQSAAEIAGIFQGSAGQTADLLQLQNGAGIVLTSVAASGAVNIDTSATSGATALTIKNPNSSGSAYINFIDGSNANVGSFNNNGGGLSYQSGTTFYGFDGLYTGTGKNIRVGGNGLGGGASVDSPVGATFTDGLFQVRPATATTVAQVIQGTTAQTSDLLQFRNVGGTVMTRVSANGTISSPGAGAGSERFGVGSSSAGNDNQVFGNGAIGGTGVNNAVFGKGAFITSGNNSVVIGNGANVASQGVAVGQGAYAYDSALALGTASSAGGQLGLAFGNNASAVGAASIALGAGSVTTASNQLVIGGNTGLGGINSIYVGTGVTDTSPTGFTIQATGGSGSNIAGGAVNLAGGKGTGTGAGGDINLQIAIPGAIGTTLNALSSVVTVSGTDGAATFRNATNSAAAFRIQNAAGTSLLNFDTTNGKLTVVSLEVGTITINGQIVTGGNAPTVPTANAAAGTGATCAISSGNETSGTITLTTGTGATAGAGCTFTVSFASAPRPVVSGVNQASAALAPFMSATTTTFTFGTNGTPANSTTYTYNYFNVR